MVDAESKEMVAANLTIAFYAAQEKRTAFFGKDRRQRNVLPEGQRDSRENTVTTREVFNIYKDFLSMLKAQK